MLTFSEAVANAEDRATVESEVRLLAPNGTAMAGVFTWNAAFTELTFNPTGRLKYQSTYTISTGPATASAAASVVKASVTPGDVPFTTMLMSDFNGDGFADLVLASPQKDVGGVEKVGQAYVYNGAAVGISATPSLIFSGVGQPQEIFGNAHAAADVNGDGYADLIVGAPGRGSFAGGVDVYNGSATGLSGTPNLTLAGAQASAVLGSFVANVGDVNGDGFDDLSISAVRYDVDALSDAGAIFVHYGSASGVAQNPDMTILGEGQNAGLGTSATGGDFNGDGFDDLVAGASGYDGGRGQSTIYPGSPSGLLTDAASITRLTGENANDIFGYSMTVSDVNGDGYPDLALGALGWANGVGSVYVYPGAAAGISAANFARLVGDSQPDLFGLVASTGDVNGDGYDDLLIGAPYAVADARDGKAYLHNGSATGSEQAPSITWDGTGAEYLGVVYPSLDLNGDGLLDAIVGAPYYDAERGRAFIHYGDGSAFSAPPVELTGESVGDHFSDNLQPS
jgi:hypothetical protein